MDKIFKNDKIMGIVAIVTLVLVCVMVWKSCKAKSETPKSETPKLETEPVEAQNNKLLTIQK